MTATAEVEADEMTGLYKNGDRWWIRRVRSPVDATLAKPLSTGTSDDALARRVRDMVKAWRTNGSEKQREWLDKAVRGEVKLLDLFNRSKRGELDELARDLKRAAADSRERDLNKLVEAWIDEDLNTRDDCRARTKLDYIRNVRFFIPAGGRFPASKLDEKYVRSQLRELKGARANKTKKVQSGTRRNYITGLQQFVNYALKEDAITVDPLRFAGGKRGWGGKRRVRRVYHEYPTVRKIMEKVSDAECFACLAMIFGSGIELGGVLDQKRMHIGETLADGRGTIIVPGRDSSVSKEDRKNVEFRSERTIFVDKWAWDILKPYVDSLKLLPRAKLWSWSAKTKGRKLRETFYRAQVESGYLEEPPRSAKGNPRWDEVQPHTLHDARHSYCINRSLGLDGETPRSAGFCAHQLGHGSEQMVHAVYKKAGVEERVATLQLAAAMEEARRVAVGA